MENPLLSFRKRIKDAWTEVPGIRVQGDYRSQAGGILSRHSEQYPFPSE